VKVLRLSIDEDANSPIDNRELAILPIAIAAATTTTATTAESTATPATATTAARTAIAAATAKIITGWARLVHRQAASPQRLTIQAGNGAFHILALCQFDKSEASRLSRDFVANDDSRGGLKTGTTHKLTQLSVGNFVGEVSYK